MKATAISEVAIDRELVRRGGLVEFVRLAWPHVEPTEYVQSWHVEEVCRHLEAVHRGECRKLIVNVPPGMSKSLLTCVFWPTWSWVEDPTTRWLFASFDAGLTRESNEKARALMQSEWFLARWPHVSFPSERVASSYYKNTAGGWRFSTSIQGKATGRHADFRVVDDPIKPKDASGRSLTVTRGALDAVVSWWKNTWRSRMRDPKTVRDVVIMQRLHEDDLCGHLLKQGGYEHLRLPMRYEAGHPCVTSVGGDRRSDEGELLCPERFPDAVVDELESKEMGPFVAAAQLQQRPVPAGGGIFRRDWFRFWHHHPDVAYGEAAAKLLGLPEAAEWKCSTMPPRGFWSQSWDMSFKGSDGSDYVAGGVWFRAGGSFFLVDQERERMSFTESVDAVKRLTQRWPKAIQKLVEDKANGPAVQDALKKEIPGIVLVNPEGGKEARANAVQPLFVAGNVYLPHPNLAPWVGEYMAEMCAFPRGANDDQVDQTTQALLRLYTRGSSLLEAMKVVRGSA